MARGGRGYAAVPAGDDHTPRRADGRRMDTEDEGADAEHDRAQLTGGVARSDQVESDSDSEEEAATQQRESAAPSTTSTVAPSATATASAGAAVVAAEVERPQEERADRKAEEAGHRDNNSNNNDNNNQHTETSASSPAAEASATAPSAASASPTAEAAEEEEPLPPGAIRIRILDLNGKFFSIACQLDWRVARLKDKVHEAADVAVAAQRLIYRGRVLEDDKVLDDYKLEDGHTVHLFVRVNAAPEPEPAAADAATSGAGANAPTLSRFGDDGVTIVHITSETISSAVFPSDSARRVDPLMLDSPLGNCARRVKLWSSFLLIIYTMKVMGQFALLANDQQMRQEQNSAKDDSNGQDRYYDRYDYPPYYNQDPMVSALELMVHAFGVYVGCVGFKAAHDTDIRPIRFYCRGIVWLAFLTVLEQMYVTYQISQSDYPETRIQYPYGPAAPSKDDIISANVFQTIMLVVMWIIAIAHSYAHQAEVARYNESFAAAAMNAVPPAHLPENVV